MGKTYKRKPGSRNYKNYSDVNLEEALTKVATGKLSIRAASNQYNISFGTLYNKFKGLHTKKPGGQTVLSELEEKCIIREIVKCGDWGFPISMLDLRMFIKHYLDTKGRTCTSLKNNLPGKDLVYSMLKRHKSEASQRLCANIKRTRACLSHQQYAIISRIWPQQLLMCLLPIFIILTKQIGVRATGIFPLHEDKVLSKLPEAQEESTLGQQVNDTPTQFLQSQRTALEPAIRRKRNRLNVEPGRSITAPHESSSDSDVDTPPDETSTSDDSAESSSEGNDETPETLSGKDGKEIEVGNFVL
ncbi:hypothetical protein ANN_01349, partial [Periplaneta americana]